MTQSEWHELLKEGGLRARLALLRAAEADADGILCPFLLKYLDGENVSNPDGVNMHVLMTKREYEYIQRLDGIGYVRSPATDGDAMGFDSRRHVCVSWWPPYFPERMAAILAERDA